MGWTQFLWAFLAGGAICLIAQIIWETFGLSPAHTMVLFVVIGVIVGSFGWYDRLVDFAGAGATIPISNFGNILVKGAKAGLEESATLSSLLKGILEEARTGVTAAVIFSFFVAAVCRPKG